jgi:hypothetical protein
MAEKRETWCMGCGDPITRSDMGLTAIDERAAEWGETDFCKVKLHFCRSCWNERKEWLKEGIRGAVERQEAKVRAPNAIGKQGDYT